MAARMIWNEDGEVHHTTLFPCDCGGEGLVIMDITVEESGKPIPQGPMVSIGFYEHTVKYRDTRMGWKERWRFAKACLKGRPFVDMVMLNKDTALAFAGSLIESIEMLDDKDEN